MADQADDGVGAAAPEPYQSLYRRYRPQRFSEVKGQEHVTRALRNAVSSGRVAHAYLFSGPRGTGKTSTARILAMALNCEHPEGGEPDGVCPSCVEIRRGSSLDVHELDAASNRKLDEMRDLLGRVALGTSGRWKVYIIDEVHQLTSDAASALLKTLEEPPGHVVFVLATTDPQKVLPTIRSRTQAYEFRLLPQEVLGDLLRDVNERAALGVRPEAIDLVVRRGHGSARDALSVLDQVAAAGVVEDETEVVSDVVEALADRDAGRVLVAVAEAMSAGRDPRRLTADVLELLRNGFLALQARSLVMLADDALVRVEEQAHRLGLAALVRAMEVLGQALTEMRDSVDPRISLEVALVRLARPEADVSSAALLERIERLERRAATGNVATSSTPPSEAIAGPVPRPRPPADDVAAPAGIEREAPAPPGPPPPPVAPPQRPPTGSGPSLPPPPPAPPPRSASGRLGEAPVPSSSLPSEVGGDSGERAALGAHRRSGGPGRRPTLSPVPTPADGPGDPPAPAITTGPRPTTSVASARRCPSRDELTKAWGDVVLGRLSLRAKAFMAVGRFLEVDDGVAVFALPDPPLVARAEEVRGEAEAALGAHFRTSVRLRLVLDSGAVAVDRSAPPPEADAGEAEYLDLTELEDAPAGLSSPEQRLLEAFPGAEEVTP